MREAVRRGLTASWDSTSAKPAASPKTESVPPAQTERPAMQSMPASARLYPLNSCADRSPSSCCEGEDNSCSIAGSNCFCDEACVGFGDCCDDYCATCGGC